MPARPAYSRVHLWLTLLGLLMSFAVHGAEAVEFFEKKAARVLSPGTQVDADSTVGGYPIYQGENNWRYLSSKVDGPNNMGVSYGTVELASPYRGRFFVQMAVTVNLDQSARDFYFPAELCGGEHLVKSSTVTSLAGEGATEDCMTVDPLTAPIGGALVTLLDVRVSNMQSASRFYTMRIVLDPAVLGHPDTLVSDWTKTLLATNPDRSTFVERLTAWARQLQAAVKTAIGFGKPKDAFKTVPSFRDLQSPAQGSTATKPAS